LIVILNKELKMIGFVVGEDIGAKYIKCENYLYWQNEYNKAQKQIMKFPIHKVKSKECQVFIEIRENAYNEMKKYRIE